MLDFLFKKDTVPVKELTKPFQLNELELISLHIPKTAGTSFYQILQDQYGKEAVKRIDIVGGRLEVNQQELVNPKTLAHCRVIHGHFRMDDLKTWFEADWSAAQLITWLREPSERVISNYYYLAGVLDQCVDKTRFPNLLPKMQRTLIEYARYEKARNRMTGFLRGLTVDDFDFMGLTNNFNKDVKRLADQLGWEKEVSLYHHNETRKKDRQIPAEVLEEIKTLNREDYNLYDRAKAKTSAQ